jgi:uncharacterized protein (DUF2235 family)
MFPAVYLLDALFEDTLLVYLFSLSNRSGAANFRKEDNCPFVRSAPANNRTYQLATRISGIAMAKRIILLSDGTGHSAASIWRTNVWRLFQAIDLTKADQIASYDDGIGTSRFKPFAWFGGMFGYGLKRNVIEAYKFLCRNYSTDPVDRTKPEIFAFGFSRGAFTIRVLLELLMSEGVVRYNGSERDLHRNALAAYGSFRKKKGGALFERFVRLFGSIFRKQKHDGQANLEPPEIRFVGLWDTVSAYGLPIAEMTKLFSRVIWSLDLAGTELDQRVFRACHALALDEERTTFHPLLWNEELEAASGRERINQVWFSGVHSNIGGGYPDDALAHIPLIWMMKEAARYGLLFKKPPESDPDVMRQLGSMADKDGRLYDSRSGLAASYRYGPRKLSELCNNRTGRESDRVVIKGPKIHRTVFDRMQAGAFPYAPLGLPADYRVVDDDGRPPEVPFESAKQADARALRQEVVWNWVFLRSTIYFTTLTAAAALFLYPFFYQAPPSAEFNSPFIWVSDLIHLIGAFLPAFFSFWINSYARTPEIFMAGAVLLVLSQWLGKKLKASISDEIRLVWRLSLSGLPVEPEGMLFYRLRTNRAFLLLRNSIKNDFIPGIAMMLVAILFFGFLFHAIFYITDAAGLYCRGSEPGDLRTLGLDQEASFRFMPSDICNKSRIVLEENATYSISINPERFDFDARVNSNSINIPALKRFRGLSSTIYALAWPTRRTLSRPWFTVIGRVGRVGADEFFFDPNSDGLPRLDEIYRPHRSGELFVYVNDISLPFPRLSDFFYRGNKGSAEVVVERRK